MNKNIVCLGGGIGTVNLIKGLKDHVDDITVVVSMADEGGSSGRLRRMFKMFPPGDIISCMAAFYKGKNSNVSKLLTYRFPGNRYGKDGDLSGHKLGNLIMVALKNITGSFDEAIFLFQHIFDISGKFLPATVETVTISAKTIEGKEIFGEENIDLGKYTGKRILDEVYVHPADVHTPKAVGDALEQADVVVAGPGDLYTTILPVLIISDIKKFLTQTKKKKIFIVNVANKPFETKGYDVSDYIDAVKKHLGVFPFDSIVVNNNYGITIPKKLHYSYVKNSRMQKKDIHVQCISDDLVDEAFPIYHSSAKLAKTIMENI
ncbi:MAG: hypothetical protein A3F31_05290 [Candidatus Levybacteria bacterium RIFCSPHIGHO2_12_FULL_38_12]|nr:MAG: hypothetical protein A2770_02100 [Candidatus Levybacteria bacterium RIFCSPHIGHO2_01_FULL_38_12]OGH22275.1 MAG: hypothetical protein A3D75_01725 [Candidatus Levybacteria bacterium RIFCSPHIGHO2_02_FULL_37_18]OGH23363.1 MAG: hypothetical protein A3F31_05290 [Candidatus Levybacteria bacterium RIFCSPHIGHO2_12_FULL_38_12]OGH34538.1 MAG: hypothetical protein A3A47_01050 [Candidatus Levybacteria bacterium RIFCSPLOWO2_01_FULL_37_20]OGH43419.1 MAG: hypothetical protein A3J14_02755 [Candidatus Lev